MAVKNNLNSLWGILVSFAVIIVLGIIGVVFIFVPYGGYIAYSIFLILSLLGNFLFHKHYQKSSKVLFKSI